MNKPLPINKNAAPINVRQQQHSAPPTVTNSSGSGGVADSVRVPADLVAFASTPQFQRVLLNVKEQSQINFISMKRNEASKEAETILIDAPNADSALIAKKLLELHFKQHLKLQRAESRLEQVQGDLFNAQGELASGMMIEFKVSQDLVGMLIGKGGSRIKEVEQSTGIKSVNVDGVIGKVTIVGPDSASVQRAREALELFESAYDITPAQADYLSDVRNGSLSDVRNGAELIVCRVDRASNQIVVIGTAFAVRSARIILNTELEYITKQMELEGAERMARDQLTTFKKQYNIYTPSGPWKAAGGVPGPEGRVGGGRGAGRGRGDRGGRGGDGATSANTGGSSSSYSNNASSSGSLASLPLPRKPAQAPAPAPVAATPPTAPAQAETKKLPKKEKKESSNPPQTTGSADSAAEALSNLTIDATGSYRSTRLRKTEASHSSSTDVKPSPSPVQHAAGPAPAPEVAPEAGATGSAERKKRPKNKQKVTAETVPQSEGVPAAAAAPKAPAAAAAPKAPAAAAAPKAPAAAAAPKAPAAAAAPKAPAAAAAPKAPVPQSEGAPAAAPVADAEDPSPRPRRTRKPRDAAKPQP